ELEVILSRVAERRDLANKAVALETRLKAAEGTPLLIGETPVMQQVRRLIETIAPTDASVMSLGQTGTGKELISRNLHHKSPRAQRTPSRDSHSGAVPREAVLSAHHVRDLAPPLARAQARHRRLGPAHARPLCVAARPDASDPRPRIARPPLDPRLAREYPRA